MNLQAVSCVRIYTQLDAKNWETAFKWYAEYRVIASIKGSPTVNGDEASIPVEDPAAAQAGLPTEKVGGKWMILPPG